jgi:hypothetical protein
VPSKREADLARAARDEDLALSGLAKPATLKRLQLGTVLGVDETRELTGLEQQAVSYEIPYFTPDGTRLKHSRWKIISVGEDLPLKYYQEPKTIPRLYFPPLLDWSKVVSDTSRAILITEGEKKAACACLHGMPAVGLGGVWNWKSKKWAMPVVRDFDLVDWKDREVEICYDADMSENENVARALDALTGVLSKRGAAVFIRYLPQAEGLSSLDDFLVSKGRQEYEELECPEADFSEKLRAFNSDLVYVVEMVGYYSTRERVFYSNPQKLLQRYGDIKILSESGRQTPAIKEWAEWPHRRMVTRLSYEPGKERFANGALNDWRGWGVKPRRGEVGGLLDVIRSIDDHEWLLQWLAYPLQNPGAKMYTAVLVWSAETGTGKTFIGSVMRDIYGADNSGTITSDDLHDERLSWLRNKQFILGEEVSSSNRRADSGVLKHVITGETVRVNEKYQPAYTLPNKANFMFTSNNPDAVRIERGDRRFWVGRLSKHRPQKFWDELDRWRKADGGGAFMYYLLKSVDLKGFNPRARAPETDEKAHMIYTGMSSLEQWCEDLMMDPDQFFGDVAALAKGKDVFEVADLMAFMPPELERMTPTPTAVGRALARTGAVRAGVVRVGGATKRLLAVRNLEFWDEHRSDKAAWAANYAGKMTVGDKKRRRG